MKMSEYLSSIIGLGAIVFGIAGIGYGIDCRKRMNDVCDKINAKVNEVSDNMEIDIPEAIVKVAVDNAVKKEAEYQVKNATTRVIFDIESSIENKVNKAIEERYSDISKSVGTRIVKELSNMDLSKLRKQVREDAAEKVADKLENELDDIVAKFTNNLNSISMIYEKMADKMSTKTDDNEIKIRLI